MVNRNQIVFTVKRSIWKQTEIRLVPNQSVNGKHNLISVDLTRIRSRYLLCIASPITDQENWGGGRGPELQASADSLLRQSIPEITFLSIHKICNFLSIHEDNKNFPQTHPLNNQQIDFAAAI